MRISPLNILWAAQAAMQDTVICQETQGCDILGCIMTGHPQHFNRGTKAFVPRWAKAKDWFYPENRFIFAWMLSSVIFQI